MKTTDFNRDIEVKNYLIDYIEERNENSFVELYKILKDDLVNVLFRPLDVLPPDTQREKRGFLSKERDRRIREIIDRIDKRIDNSTNPSRRARAISIRGQYWEKLSVHIKYNNFFDNAREDFYSECLCIDNPDPYSKKVGEDFMRVFWLSLKNLNIDIIHDKMSQWHIVTYQYFIVVRFADYYWHFLETKYRQYYVFLKTKKAAYSKIVMSIDSFSANVDESYKLDVIEFKNNHYCNVETAQELNLDKLPLQGRQREIYSYLVAGLKNKEIADLMGIDASTISTQKARIKAKVLEYINYDENVS